MKTLRLLTAAAALLPTVFGASAESIPVVSPDSENIAAPERAIILSGGENGINRQVMAVLYDTSEAHFQDPDMPRFLLIDRKGSTVFGIGGYVEGVAQYDFDGAIDGNGFATDKIPVPADPSLRNRFGADVSHTNLVMQLLTNTRLGVFSAYVQANFSGNGGYGFKLKQAYVKLGNVTAGLARSTFQDGNAGVPTIDYQGPSGAVSAKNVLLQYKKGLGSGFSFALSAEMPQASYTPYANTAKSINQRVPDIPAYVQYSWDGGKSHVRASAIWRNLSYRDLVTAENRFATGWGIQLSGVANITNRAKLFYQVVYGKGIGRYINDLSGDGFDLIADGTNGAMKAPGTFDVVGGVRFNITPQLFLSASYSFCRLYNQEEMTPNTYRRGNYAVVNAFYTPCSDLQLGLEYLNGQLTDMNHAQGSANRIEAMLKYSF